MRPQTLDTASGTPIIVAHKHMQLPIKLLKKSVLLYVTGKLCFKFGEGWSVTNVTMLYTDAIWTADGRMDNGHAISFGTLSKLCQMRCTALGRQLF